MNIAKAEELSKNSFKLSVFTNALVDDNNDICLIKNQNGGDFSQPSK